MKPISTFVACARHLKSGLADLAASTVIRTAVLTAEAVVFVELELEPAWETTAPEATALSLLLLTDTQFQHKNSNSR